ncbi:MAG: FAD-dependent oxidoreductase [Microthrixaceae bacterium]|nr:FAD-dependent oxidoreductase [Microthrixaceae bacterium]
MATRTYDAIVIGAGHNGLCLAAYLQRAGLSTAIIERRHEEGGGVNTEEPVMAGYRHNMHAQFMEFFDVMPMIQDFDLYGLGLRTVTPDAQAGIAFADGRPPVILHRPELLDRTHKSISQYSKADADTFVEVKKRAANFQQLLAVGLYNPPGASMAMGVWTPRWRCSRRPSATWAWAATTCTSHRRWSSTSSSRHPSCGR